MYSEKENWIKKYAEKALNSWRNHAHFFEISSEYRYQLESDMASRYDDPLMRQFIEGTWGS